MTQYIPLPDGNSLKLREGESPAQGWERAQQMYPEAFGGRRDEGVKRDTTGFKAALSANTSRAQGEAALTAAKLGLMDPAEAEKYYKAKEEEAQARFTPTEAGWSEAPLLKFRETLGGSVPYMALPAAAAGIAALSATGVGAPAAAALAAGAGAFGVNAAQFTGSNLASQMRTGKSLEETSGAAAFGAAIPQAAMDTAVMALMPGFGKLFGSVGEKLTVDQARALASQTLGKTIADYSAKTGAAMGREGFTEAAQQVLERLQAGLSITDEDARKDYIDNFLGGAALAAVGAPMGRAIERGAAKDQAAQADKEEKAKARAVALLQQEQAATAEKQRLADEAAAAEAERNSPEYALKIAQQYAELEQKVKDLQSQVRKGSKETPLTAEDKAFNTEITGQLKDAAKELKTVAAEKNRVTQSGLLGQAQEAQRREQMSPEDFLLDQAGEVPTYTPSKPGAYPEVDMGGIPMPSASPEELERQRAQAAPAQYAAERIQLAQDQLINPTGQEYVDYLMKDPAMARQVVEQKLDFPGLSPSISALLRKTMATQFKETDKANAAEAGARQEFIRTAMADRVPGAEMLTAMREQPGVQAAQEERTAEDKRLSKVLPESYALQRMAEKPPVAVRAEDNLTTQVDALVDSLLQKGAAPAGRVVAGATAETGTKADTLRAQLSYANATDNRERANELKKQLADLNEPETEKGAGDLEFGEAAKKAGIEGRLTPDAMRANRVTRLSNSQLDAYDRLADFVQRVREGNQEVSDSRKQTFLGAAERLKETVVGLALNEIDARRAQAGLPEMPVNDKARAVGQFNQTLDELIERGAGLFQKPIERKAQMRGTKIVAGAQEDVGQPVGRRVFNNFEAAAKALRGQLREDIDRIGGFEPTEPVERKESKPQRAGEPLRRQWQVASEREIGQQFTAAYDRAETDEDYRALKEIEAKFKNLSETAQAEALVQVRRVENGLPLEIRGQLKEELADLRAAGVSETGQTELFPGESEKGVTRTTPARFAALLNSKKLKELKAKLAEENRVMEFQAKRAATIEAKAKKEAADAEAFQKKMLDSKAKTPAQQAKDALTKLTGPESKAVQATELADQIITQRNAVRTRLRAMISQIEDSERKAQKQFDDVKSLYDYTNGQLELVQTQAAASGIAPSMSDLALWTEARDGQTKELNKARKTLDAVQKSLTAARDTLAKVTEDHASNTVDNALIREGEKAQRKIDAAKEALRAAEAEERTAARLLAAEKEAKPEPTVSDKDRLEAYAKAVGADVIRVYRDTSDKKVQARVAEERKNVAAAEEAHAQAELAGDKLGMENALRRIEAAYNKMYEILNNAPTRREVAMTDAQVKAQEAFDKAQADTFEATLKLFEEQAGIKPLKMAKRRTIASVRNVKAGRIETQIKKESVAAQEARVKQEEATGQYPARALESLAKARAELAEVQRQLDFIKDNPAAPRSEAKARQTAAKTAATAKKAALTAKIKELVVAQQAVVKEAKLEKQAEKALRKEKNAMMRKPGYLQEAVGDEQFEAPSGRVEINRYKGIATWMVKGPERHAIIEINAVLKNGSESLAAGLGDAKAKLRAAIAEYSTETNYKFKALVEQKRAALQALEKMRVGDFDITQPERQRSVSVAAALPVTKTKTTASFEDFTSDGVAEALETTFAEDAPFHGMTFAEAARYGAKRSSSSQVKALFEKLAEVFDNAPVHEGSGRVYAVNSSINKKFGGIYNSRLDVVYSIAPSKTNQSANKILLHELTHAATVRAMQLSPELGRRMEELRQRARAWLSTPEGRTYFRQHSMGLGRTPADIYALSNNREFVAELFANREFQKMLVEIPSDKPRKSIFTRFVEVMSQFFNMPGKAAQSLFAEAVALTEEVLDTTKNQVYEGVAPKSGFLLEVTPYEETAPNALSDLADKIVAKPKSFTDQVKEIKTLELQMSGVDARAALEEVLKRGAAAMGDDTKYKQAMYLVRKRDDVFNEARAVMANGAPELFKDEKGFIGVRTSGNDTGADVFEAVGKVPAGSSQEKFAIASTYLIARRANNKGLEKLDVGALGIDQAELDAALAAAEADPAMAAALNNVARRYNAYNKGLIEFNVATGAIPKDMGAELLSKGDYIPFYRVRDNGVAELVFSDKMVFTVGDIRNQPYLAELKGGEDKIMPLNESLPRNTMLLVDKALTNLAERNVAYALQDLGKGKGPIDPNTGKPKNLMAIHKGDGPDDASVIRFNQEPDADDPKDTGKRWLKVQSEGTAIEGVPAELVVKSLEGASLPLPGFLKLAGAASDLLRTGVTRTPLYIARQLYKEPMAAAFTGGLSYSPFRAVLEAGKEYVRMMRGNSATQAKLIEKGLIQSQIFSGAPSDLSKVALQLAKGGDQTTINKMFGWLDKAAINADAATRALVYENARKNGLSEVEAEHMAREFMNFSKRGSNAAVQYATRLIPFMNAQIQSLNVLYKAMTGQMPFEEQLRIKKKFFNNAMLLFGTGLVYAMAMEDDEYFKNARPRDKYTNFFLHLPGVEEPIKIATPFEAGYFFSLAVAAVDGMKAETNNAEQFAALRDLFLQSIPGYSSMGMPQIVKPAFEVWTNKNFLSGAPIESLRLKNLEVSERYTESTTELAKAMSKAIPILSPIQIEHIVRGYLGVAPLAAAAMINGAVPGAERGERPTTRASELPLLGSAFQRKMGGAQADEVFDLAEAAFQARTTYNTMLKEGRKEDAKDYRDERKVELASAIDAGHYRQLIGRLNSDIRRTQNRTDLTGEEKRVRLDRLEDAKLKAAKDFLTRYRAREDRLGG